MHMHCMQRGLVTIKLPVRLKRVICDKTKEICVPILIRHERSFILERRSERKCGGKEE